MADDPLERARIALQRAQSAAREGSEVLTPILLDAIRHITASLDNLQARESNLAVQQALLDDRLLRVERNRLFTAFNRLVTTGANLLRRLKPEPPEPESVDPAAYQKWIAHESASLPSPEQAQAAANGWRHKPTISILMVVRNGETLSACLQSIGQQVYGSWELCAAIEHACESRLAEFRGNTRKTPADGLDDAQALNAAATLATGEYLLVLPETGVLSPFALYSVAEALQQGPADLLYSDEDSLDTEGRRARPLFKPDWSPELLLSSIYMRHSLTVRRTKFLEVGGFSSDYDEVYLLDLALRLSDKPVRVHHIPKVLYHAAKSPPAPAAQTGMARAIMKAVARREQKESTCVPGPAPGTLVIRRKQPTPQMTAIVCSRSPALLETCLASVRATAGAVVRQIVVVAHEDSGPNAALQRVIRSAGAVAVPFGGAFHFAAMNNLGAAAAESSNLLFLNDDIRASESGWAEWLAEQVSREEVGVAGAVLRYPTGLIQHAGIVVGIGDGVGHAGRYMRPTELWPWLFANREVSAVTGACLAIRKELFAQLGRFDTLFPNNYNDVDLCFRARARGYRVVCVPVEGLIHAECQSRPGIVRFEERYRFYERWADLLGRPDPYYSTALAPTERIALNLSEDRWHRLLFPLPPG